MRRKKCFNGVLWIFSTVINLRYSGFLKMKRVSKEAPPARKLELVYSRSSRPECSVKEVFWETSQNLQENTCVRDSFLIKLWTTACNVIKKELWHRCFPVNFAKYLRTPFSTEHIWWLLLVFLEKHEGR